MADAKSRVEVTLIVVALVVAIAAGAWFGRSRGLEGAALSTSVSTTTIEGDVTVHVAGAVVRPGLVSVAAAARIADAIAAAGGAAADADLGRVNLAAAVRDGDRIDVPRAGGPDSKPDAEGGIDLNRSSVTDLERLPGVGPVLAARIVTWREEHGPFTEVEDLLDVPGIGEAKLAQIRDGVDAP